MILQKYPAAEVLTSVVDVSNVEQVESFHAAAVEKFGRIDFTANVAGYGHLPTPSIALKSSEINKSFAVNLKGVRHALAFTICRPPLTLGIGLSLRAGTTSSDAEAVSIRRIREPR